MITQRSTRLVPITLIATVVAAAAVAARTAPTPAPSPTIGAMPPDDATIVLFDGRTWEGWRTPDGKPSQWKVMPDGSVQVFAGSAVTSRLFGDFQLHVEYISPETPDKTGQARSNSGVYLHGRYEVQVLNSYGDPPLGDGCGAIYSIAPPHVNACRPGGEVNTYDIYFRAPRFDGDDVTEPARVTVVHNGVCIHNNIDLPHTTPVGIATDIVPEGPLWLQDHGDPVRYRNIWIRELD